MKKSHTWKVVLIVIIVALSIFGLYSQPIRRGIDLRGGGELLFRIDEKGVDDAQLITLAEDTVDIIRKRVDPTGERGLIIQAKDQLRVMIQLPGFSREQTKEIIALATNMGRLEFRLVVDDPTKEALLKGGKTLPGHAWYSYAESALELMRERAKRGEGPAEIPEGKVVRTDDSYSITGEYLARVFPTTDETGGPAVGFEMKLEGARRFARLTGDHEGEDLAIILNDRVYSAPRIETKIFDRGIIRGAFRAAEVDMLVKTLKSGSLKAALILESEQYVGPTLGAVTIQKGLRAGLIAAICVVSFMLAYYLLAGLVADFALCLNILILLAVMAVSQATLTLPGIAGIVLTVGVAVDANVLIFERLREELRLGRELPVAVRMGYEKAFTAIFDSNFTTFATAAILYILGSGPVRGFAITLSIGIIVSFFTAVFVTRVIVELLVKHGLARSMRMLHILTRTGIPFMRYARLAMVASVAAIGFGVWVFYVRGEQNLDIDFTGGSVAHLELAQELPIDEVRRRVAEAGYKDAKVQSLASEIVDIEGGAEVSGAADAGLLARGKRFALRVQLSENKTLQQFEEQMAVAFEDVAQTRGVEFDVRGTTEIKAKNDPLYGGVRIEVSLNEPLPAAKITAGVAALSLATYELKLYEIDEATGALKTLSEDAPAVSVLSIATKDMTGDQLSDKLAGAFAVANPFPEQISQVGPEVAHEMVINAFLAIGLAMMFIVVYIWFRFGRIRYGFAAVVALAHDVLFTLGAIAVGDALGGTALGRALLLGDFKINLGVIAALLTIVGYSLNDTIVVFDRIRENMRLKTRSDWEIVTGSINQTLSRTILTSFTTLVVVVTMYVYGGSGIHSFSYVMLVGIIVGTYSSIFIASPVLLFKEVLQGAPIPKKA
ncbi:MAG: protein translocase subunit SecD [Planctomycetota bacterium]|jgi:SecD/SecF fusion protein